MTDQLEQKLDDHILYDKEKFGGIASDIKDIKGNHLFHIEKDMGTLKTDVSVLKTDTSWIKKIQWFLITTSIGTLLTLLTGLIFIIFKK